ncbi:MAG: hypothetical protein QXO04_00205 [Nitrososphaerota archaeon]
MVSELILYTPGHSLYTDTLITYGITRPLVKILDESEELEVLGTGSNYVIRVRGLDLKRLSEAVTEQMKKDSARFRRELIFVTKSEAETYLDGRIGLLSEKDVSNFISKFEDEAGLKSFLESLQSPLHAQSEGKIVAGKIAKSKLKLPLMPTSGKYLAQDMTMVNKFSDDKYYRVCDYCAAFAAAGLCYGALTAKLEKWVIIITLGFEGKVDGAVIKYTLSLIEDEVNALAGIRRGTKISDIGGPAPLSLELSLATDSIPLRTLLQSMLCLFTDTAIRGFSESNASWKALSVKFDASRAKSGNLQVRGYDEVLLDPVISALADLMRKSMMPDLRERIKKLLRASRSKGPESGDAITALESLFTFFQTRRISDLYSFVRSYEVSMDRLYKSMKYKHSLSKKVCSELISLSRRL